MKRAFALLAGALIVASGGLISVGPAHSAPADNGNSDAVANFGACLASERSGDVLLLIDQSGSLTGSDPDGARVTSANYLLERLESYSRSAGVTIDVGVAGFAEKFVPDDAPVKWTALDESTLPGLHSDVEQFGNRVDGQATDYWMALDGSRRALSAHRDRSAIGRSCQAVAWFTDGKIDFERGGTEKPYAPGVSLSTQAGVESVVAAAQESICRPGGIADQLRTSGITLFGIGLAAGTATPADFDVLRSVVTGSAPGAEACGKVTQPSPGSFYLAQNIDDLLFAFDEISTPGQVPLSRETGVCPQDVCEEGKHRFVLDGSISAVEVLASADSDGLVPVLLNPAGDRLDLTKSDSETKADLAGAEVTYRWQSPRTVSFDLQKASTAQWDGLWSLVFVDPTGSLTSARSKSNIHISGNLFPEWKGAEKAVVHSGETAVPVDLGIVDGQRKPFDAGTLLGTATLSAVLIDRTGQERTIVAGLDKGSIEQPVTMDLTGVDAGPATVRLTLDVTTADAKLANGTVEPGTALAPQSVDVQLDVASPIGFPTVSGPLSFGKVEGAGRFTADLSVTGPGCVWVPAGKDATFAASPDGVGVVGIGAVDATSEQTCIQVGAGVDSSVPMSLDVENAANGTLGGTIEVMIAPTNEFDRSMPVTVSYEAELAKSLNPTNFWITLLCALILGPGIPLLLLYGAKWVTAKIPARILKGDQFTVTLSGTSVLRNGRPFELTDRDLVQVVPGLHTPARSLVVAGIELQSKTGWSPFGAGYVVAKTPGLAGASPYTPRSWGKAPYARLPLAVHNSWFVLINPTVESSEVTAVVLLSGDADASKRREIANDVKSRLPEVVADLRARAKPEESTPDSGSGPMGTPDPNNPFGGQPGGGAGPATGPSNPFGGGGPVGNPSAPGGSGSGNSFGNPFGGGGGQGRGPSAPGTSSGGNPFGNG